MRGASGEMLRSEHEVEKFLVGVVLLVAHRQLLKIRGLDVKAFPHGKLMQIKEFL